MIVTILGFRGQYLIHNFNKGYLYKNGMWGGYPQHSFDIVSYKTLRESIQKIKQKYNNVNKIPLNYKAYSTAVGIICSFNIGKKTG